MLRSFFFALLLLLLGSLMLGRVGGQDKPDPAAVLERGIKALGGEANLVKYRAATWKAKGTYYGLKGKGDEFSGEWAVQPPNHFRADVEFQRNGVTFHEVRVINGDKGWIKLEKQDAQELDKDALEEEKKLMNAQWLTLVPLLRDKSFQLEALPDSMVDGIAVAGIKVTRGGSEFRLYFSKETGLLRKSERRLKDEGGREVKQEVLYSDYADHNGMQHAMKRVVLRDGKKFIEERISDYKPAENVDEKLFLKP
jgi:hypothetical protein